MTAVVTARGLSAKFGDRVLFQNLTLTLESEKVALIGRNGVGKSTLLSILSGRAAPSAGRLEVLREVFFVPQTVSGDQASPGERRREALRLALESGAALLLLDEPTQDLDEESLVWLRRRLKDRRGGALVVSHDRRLLRDFQHFFVMEESGCRYFWGTLGEIENELERLHKAGEARYLQRLNHLEREEERTRRLARRRKRKQQYGRCSELDRATPRCTLNQKRSDAQNSHGRINRRREERLRSLREATRGARRALKVDLPLHLTAPELDPLTGPVVSTHQLSVERNERVLFHNLSLVVARERIGLTGPNGSGKTTFIRALMGEYPASQGRVDCRQELVGYIAQGAANWELRENLLELIGPDQLGQHLVAHNFPLGLAERPLRSLSAGERIRAALIALWSRSPSVELLILDEPTCSLDLLGQRVLRRVLQAWPGGLIVASHNRYFLEELGVREICFGSAPSTVRN